MENETYTKEIQIGQRVYCALPYCQHGIIYEIHGEQRAETCKNVMNGCGVTGGNAHFDIVWKNGRLSKRTPESLVRSSVQWEVSDEIAGPAEIKQALEHAVEEQRKRQHAKQKREEQKQKERAELPKKYHYLETVKDNPKTSRWALGAKNIRTELNKVSSGIKFRVRSESYSGGCSIDIYWTDGPTSKEVEKNADKYKTCDFDGMQDLETVRDTVFPEIFGGASYVFCHRTFSAEALKSIAAKMGYTIEVDKYEQIGGVDHSTTEQIRHTAYSTSFYKPPEQPQTSEQPLNAVIGEYKRASNNHASVKRERFYLRAC